MKKHPFGFYRIWHIGKSGRLKIEFDFRMVEIGARVGYDVLAGTTYFYVGLSLGPLQCWAAVDLHGARF